MILLNIEKYNLIWDIKKMCKRKKITYPLKEIKQTDLYLLLSNNWSK